LNKEFIKSVNFHHYGLALKSFRSAVKFHSNLGYIISEIIYDDIQNVELILCTSNNFPTVELVKPYDDKSPINNYLKKNNEIIYHICYEVDDIDNDLKLLFKNNRSICVSKPKPAKLFNNRLVSFYYINDIGLIELLQK